MGADRVYEKKFPKTLSKFQQESNSWTVWTLVFLDGNCPHPEKPFSNSKQDHEPNQISLQN